MSLATRSGTTSFSSSVKIGNYLEEKTLKEARMKEYLWRKDQGKLLVSSVQGNLNSSLQSVRVLVIPCVFQTLTSSYCFVCQVTLSESKDGYVHIGDQIMLYSVRVRIFACPLTARLADAQVPVALVC
jgi:hypothetical protein